VLGISPSTYYAAKKREEKPSARDMRDEALKAEMNQIKVPASVSNADSSGLIFYNWNVKQSTNVGDGSPGWLGGYFGTPGGWYNMIYWYPGLNPLGEYHAYPAADAGAPENTASFWVKLGGREQVHVTRSGSRVSVRACIQRYNDKIGGYYQRGGWQNWSGRWTTVYQFRSGGIYGKGRWVAIRSMKTGSSGCTPTYTFTYAAPRKYKATTAGTTTIWGATSLTVSK
jgi:hypothetical protein